MSDKKACPFCGEEILAVAVICKHCRSDLTSDPKRGESPTQQAHNSEAPQKAKEVLNAIIGAVMLAAIFYFVWDHRSQAIELVGNLFSNSAKPTRDLIAELEQAAPTQLSPVGEMAVMLARTGKYTNVQIKNKEEEIKGKVVAWTLPVGEVRKSKPNVFSDKWDGRYRISTSSDFKGFTGEDRIATVVYITPRNAEENRFIEGLKQGDLISYKGYISDVVSSLGSHWIAIEPAILWSAGRRGASSGPATLRQEIGGLLEDVKKLAVESAKEYEPAATAVVKGLRDTLQEPPPGTTTQRPQQQAQLDYETEQIGIFKNISRQIGDGKEYCVDPEFSGPTG